MGLFDKLRGELIDIIEWLDPSNDTMVWRFERYNNEIKMGAKLTVRESQNAVFINNGELADVFGPGMYTLTTDNLPILSTLKGWKFGFESPFKAEVYFVNTKRFTDRKWGTKNPIMLRDPEFGPLRIRAFGTYEMFVDDPARFLTEVVGTDGRFTSDEIENQLRNLIVSRFSDIIGESKIPVLDMAANYDELGEFVTKRIHDDFASYGIALTKMLIENISLPPAVEEALDKRTSMGVIGDLHKYTQFQAANAMETAAANDGMAGGGMGMGMGFAMANQMGQAFAQQQPQPTHQPPAATPPVAAGAPPPLPSQKQFHVAIGGQQVGPFDMGTLQQKVTTGEITRATLVWSQGMANWTAAGQVADLVGLFAAAPPPLPPQ